MIMLIACVHLYSLAKYYVLTFITCLKNRTLLFYDYDRTHPVEAWHFCRATGEYMRVHYDAVANQYALCVRVRARA